MRVYRFIKIWSLFCFTALISIPTSINAEEIYLDGKAIESEEYQTRRALSGPPLDSWTFQLPNSASGLEYHNGQLLMVSEQAGLLYVLNPEDGEVLRTVQLPGNSDNDPGSYGIAATHYFWWHSDYQRGKLYKLDCTNGAILQEFDMPYCLGICWDGHNLWGVNPNQNMLYRIDPVDGHTLTTTKLTGMAGPIDLTWDGEFLWVSERDGNHFHQIGEDGTIIRTIELPYNQRRNTIAAQNPFMWVTDRSNYIFKKDIGLPFNHVVGCLTVDGIPVIQAKIMIAQKNAPIDTTYTDQYGCFSFMNNLETGNFWVLIEGMYQYQEQ